MMVSCLMEMKMTNQPNRAPSTVLRDNLRNAVLSVICEGKGGYSVHYIRKCVSNQAAFEVHDGFDWSRHVRSTCKRLVQIGQLQRVGVRYYLPSQLAAADRSRKNSAISDSCQPLRKNIANGELSTSCGSMNNSVASPSDSLSSLSDSTLSEKSRNENDQPCEELQSQVHLPAKKRVSFNMSATSKTSQAHVFAGRKSLRHKNFRPLRSCLVKRSVTDYKTVNNLSLISKPRRGRPCRAKYQLRSGAPNNTGLNATQRNLRRQYSKAGVDKSDISNSTKVYRRKGMEFGGNVATQDSQSLLSSSRNSTLRARRQGVSYLPKSQPQHMSNIDRSPQNLLATEEHSNSQVSESQPSPRSLDRNHCLHMTGGEFVKENSSLANGDIMGNISTKVTKLQPFPMDQNEDNSFTTTDESSATDCDANVTSGVEECGDRVCHVQPQVLLPSVMTLPEGHSEMPSSPQHAGGESARKTDAAMTESDTERPTNFSATNDDANVANNSDAEKMTDVPAPKQHNYSFMSDATLDNSIDIRRPSYSKYRKSARAQKSGRRSQLKLLADDLTKFYAPSTDGKRRRIQVQKQSMFPPPLTPRELQLEVIRKQMSLVAKRQQIEMETAAATGVGHNVVAGPVARQSALLATELKRGSKKFAGNRAQKMPVRSAASSTCGESDEDDDWQPSETSDFEDVQSKVRAHRGPEVVMKRKRGRPSLASVRQREQMTNSRHLAGSSNQPSQQERCARRLEPPVLVSPSISEEDRELFEDCHKRFQRPITPSLLRYVIGRHELTISASTLEASGVTRSAVSRFLCEFCFMCLDSFSCLQRHLMTRCSLTNVPGNEIYRHRKVSLFEIDGRGAAVYCQSLCRLMRDLSISHSALYDDVGRYIFYALYVRDEAAGSYHFVGFFSKKRGNSVDYIAVMPQFRRHGYGRLLADMCYQILRYEGCSIFRPPGAMDEATNAVYMSCCKSLVMAWLLKSAEGRSDGLYISDISDMTGLDADEIIAAVKSLGLLITDDDQIMASVENLAAFATNDLHRHIALDVASFRWKALLHKRPRGRPRRNSTMLTPSTPLHSQNPDTDDESRTPSRQNGKSARGGLSPGVRQKSCPCCKVEAPIVDGSASSPDRPVKRPRGRPPLHRPIETQNSNPSKKLPVRTSAAKKYIKSSVAPYSLSSNHEIIGTVTVSHPGHLAQNLANMSGSDDVEPDDCELDFTLASPGIPTVADVVDKPVEQTRENSVEPDPIVIDDGGNDSGDESAMSENYVDDDDDDDPMIPCSEISKGQSSQFSSNSVLPSSAASLCSTSLNGSLLSRSPATNDTTLSPQLPVIPGGCGVIVPASVAMRPDFFAPVVVADWSRHLSRILPSTATSFSDTLTVSSPSYSLPICSAVARPSTSRVAEGFPVTTSNAGPLLSVDDLKSLGSCKKTVSEAGVANAAGDGCFVSAGNVGLRSTVAGLLSASQSSASFRLSPCRFGGTNAERLNAVAFGDATTSVGSGSALAGNNSKNCNINNNNNDVVCSVATPVMADVLLQHASKEDLPNQSAPSVVPALGLPFFGNFGAVRLPDVSSFGALMGPCAVSQAEFLSAAARQAGLMAGQDGSVATAVPMIAFFNLGPGGLGSFPAFSCAAAVIPQGALQFMNFGGNNANTGNTQPTPHT